MPLLTQLRMPTRPENLLVHRKFWKITYKFFQSFAFWNIKFRNFLSNTTEIIKRKYCHYIFKSLTFYGFYFSRILKLLLQVDTTIATHLLLMEKAVLRTLMGQGWVPPSILTMHKCGQQGQCMVSTILNFNIAKSTSVNPKYQLFR